MHDSSYDDVVLDNVIEIASSPEAMERIRAIIGAALTSDIDPDAEVERTLGDGTEARSEALLLVTGWVVRQGAAADEQRMAQEDKRIGTIWLARLQQEAKRRDVSVKQLPPDLIEGLATDVAREAGVSLEVATEMAARWIKRKGDETEAESKEDR